jgi:hypothetical protein
MLSPQQREQIRGAFLKGALQVRSMNTKGQVGWKPITAVHRAEVPWEQVHSFDLTDGSFLVVTAGHRVYVDDNEAVEAKNLTRGQRVRATPGDKRVLGWSVESRQFMFDLTVADNHNLVLHRSGVIVHNCPDRNYHFRPPEHECDIGQYNRIFGYVWTDEELKVYLDRSLDWWNMFPPRTSIRDLDCLMGGNSDWSTAIYYGAMVHALMALAINWVHEEFDYSIGGVSLSIEKSSKYESLKSNAEGQLDKATEAKQRTVKFTRGLQQPRYGIGIRSAFGPRVGRGVLSPRNFI